MTPEYIRTLIDYNYWARDRALASAATLSSEQLTKPLGSSFASVLDTLIHIRFAEWIVHVVNHGSYHRGQIATMMRQLGTKSQSSDMIVFFREQSAAVR